MGVAFFVSDFAFYIGDVLTERLGGANRKSAHVAQGGASLGITLGSILDGILDFCPRNLTCW